MALSWPPSSLPLDVESLASAIRQGAYPEFISFPDWGGSAAPDCLAPWTLTPFVLNGRLFASAEHYFMYAKARLFGDISAAGRILRARCPGQAYELGNRVRGFHRPLWAARREHLRDEANRAKFGSLPHLAAYMLSTWPAVLVQTGALDLIWCSGLDLDDPYLRRPWQWPGQNLVGFSLMRVREELRAQIARGGAAG